DQWAVHRCLPRFREVNHAGCPAPASAPNPVLWMTRPSAVTAVSRQEATRGRRKGRPPPGGERGSPSGPALGGKSRSRIGGRSLEMAWGTGAVRHAHPTTSGRYLCMLPDPVEFRREALSKFHNCFYTRQISHIR